MLFLFLRELGRKHARWVTNHEIEAVLADVRTSGQPAYLRDMAIKGLGARVAPTGSVSFLF